MQLTVICEPQSSICKCALEPLLKIVSPAWTMPGISGPETVLSSSNNKPPGFCWVTGGAVPDCVEFGRASGCLLSYGLSINPIFSPTFTPSSRGIGHLQIF